MTQGSIAGRCCGMGLSECGRINSQVFLKARQCEIETLAVSGCITGLAPLFPLPLRERADERTRSPGEGWAWIK